MKREFRLHDGKRGAALTIQVVPRARKNEIVEISGEGTILVRLKSSADPEEINRSLVAFLAEVLSIQAGKIEVVAGQSARNKLVSVLDMSTQVANERVLKSIK